MTAQLPMAPTRLCHEHPAWAALQQHYAQDIAQLVKFGLVVAQFFHLFFNAAGDAFFFTAFAGNRDQIAEELRHLLFIRLRCLFDFAGIHGALNFLSSAVA